MITFLIAGHETTSGLLSFTFFYLLKHPDAYERAQNEVDTVIGKGAITVDHLTKLPYINAVLRESLRLSPTAPVTASQAKEDTIIGGKYEIKAGVRISPQSTKQNVVSTCCGVCSFGSPSNTFTFALLIFYSDL